MGVLPYCGLKKCIELALDIKKNIYMEVSSALTGVRRVRTMAIAVLQFQYVWKRAFPCRNHVVNIFYIHTKGRWGDRMLI